MAEQLDVLDRYPLVRPGPSWIAVVTIEQIFFHCPKAFMRSQLWQPQSWHPEALRSCPTPPAR